MTANPNTAQGNEPRATLGGLLLAGGLVVLLVVLAVTTHGRLRRTEEMGRAALRTQGKLIIQSLEGAARLGMRHQMLQDKLMPLLVEEMSDQPNLESLAIIGRGGHVYVAGCERSCRRLSPEEALRGAPDEVRQAVREGRPVSLFNGDSLWVGRRFQPLRRLLAKGGPLPPWARPGMMMMRGMHMHEPEPDGEHRQGRGRGLGPGPAGRRGEPPYALAQLSTAAFAQVRDQDLRQGLLVAGLLFVLALGAGVTLWGYARRRANQVARLRQEVNQHQHLAAVGRLAASVAHEVRNPLSALKGLVQLLAKDRAPDSAQAEYARVAVEEVDRLERVVSGLLEYSRDRAPRRLPLDAAESARGAAQLLGDDPRAAGVEVTVDAPEGLPEVQADPDQLRQVLVNLIINALEALDGQGAVRVTLRPAPGGGVSFQVADDGPGLPEVNPEELFDPFYSTRERGTGLGLAIARRIVRAHGGELTAGRAPEGGALFTFTLPGGEAKP